MNRLVCSWWTGLCALVPVVFLAPEPLDAAQEAAKDKIPLRILYAGRPGSSREAEFTAFLKQHFRQVRTSDLASFGAKQAADADVVVLDYDGDGFKAPRPSLADDYARPTVTVGVAGGLLCSRLRLKTGYL